MRIIKNAGIFLACAGVGWLLWTFWDFIQGNGEYAAGQPGVSEFAYVDMILGNIGLWLIIIVAALFVIGCILTSRSRG